MDIFLSRPTHVGSTFDAGLQGFLRILKGLGLSPRTVGTTDIPNKSPLDEVIGIMKECAGAIILGYPQIVVDSGFVKDVAISSQLLLATEWNHMEAGLAYASGLPLLVIHHPGVTRGIFDRGALGAFIHSVRLDDPSWPLQEDVQGALKTWTSDIFHRRGQTEPTEHASQGKSGQHKPAHVTNDKLSPPSPSAPVAEAFCSRCGAVPGDSTSCLGWSTHDFIPWNSPAYCSRCGARPGKQSSCLGYSSHSFVQAPER